MALITPIAGEMFTNAYWLPTSATSGVFLLYDGGDTYRLGYRVGATASALDPGDLAALQTAVDNLAVVYAGAVGSPVRQAATDAIIAAFRADPDLPEAAMNRSIGVDASFGAAISALAALIASCDAADSRELAIQTGALPSGWVAPSGAQITAAEGVLTAEAATIQAPGLAYGFANVAAGEMWYASTGLADAKAPRRWMPGDVSVVGSVGKTFTAALALLCQESGDLDLDDLIDDHVPYFNGHGITIRHCLRNQSGVRDGNDVAGFNFLRAWTREDLVSYIELKAPGVQFAPGTDWEYSNTNAVIVALVIEAATGSTYETELQSRILTPLSMDNTTMHAGQAPPDTVRGVQNGVDITNTQDLRWLGPAGGFLSTPADLLKWGAAVWGGSFLSAESLSQMLDGVPADPGQEYGLGTYIETFAGVGDVHGHTGGVVGDRALLYYVPGDDRVLLTMCNSFDVTGAGIRTLAATLGAAIP